METLLKKLISFKTVTSDKKENVRALGWIAKELADLPVHIHKFQSNGYPSLAITTQRKKKAKVILAAHLDVVSGSPDIFKPKVSKSKLFGRGSFDMKFAVACYMQLLKDLNQNLRNYNIGIMITCDEEIGGNNGTEFLLKKGYGAQICILPDGGREGVFERSAKGVMQFLIQSRGKAGHASRPWEGINAIDGLIAFLALLKENFVKEPCGSEKHFHETINIGNIKGGDAPNKIPDFAEAQVNIRFTSRANQKKILKNLNAIKRKFSNIVINESAFAESYKVNIKNKYFRKFLDIYKRRLESDPSFIDSHGSSDARFFLENRIPIISVRPSGGKHHSEEEWIDLNSLNRFYSILKEFVMETAKIK